MLVYLSFLQVYLLANGVDCYFGIIANDVKYIPYRLRYFREFILHFILYFILHFRFFLFCLFCLFVVLAIIHQPSYIFSNIPPSPSPLKGLHLSLVFSPLMGKKTAPPVALTLR